MMTYYNSLYSKFPICFAKSGIIIYTPKQLVTPRVVAMAVRIAAKV